MIWVTKELELSTQKIEIMTSSMSDDSPIRWYWKVDSMIQKRWIINEVLLEHEENLEILKKDINEYFDFNTTPEVSTPTIWDAFKAFLRGRLINMNATTKKKREEQHFQINEEIKRKELELKRRPGSKKLEKQLRILKQQMNNHENREVVWNLRKLNQKIFEGANKVGRFLANQLKKRKEKNWINKISVDGKEVNTKLEIKKNFKNLHWAV